MCPSLIEIGSKAAEKNSAQTNKQTNRHYENNGHLAVNQQYQRQHRCYVSGPPLNLAVAATSELLDVLVKID